MSRERTRNVAKRRVTLSSQRRWSEGIFDHRRRSADWAVAPLQGGCGRFDSFSAHKSAGHRPNCWTASWGEWPVPHLSRTAQANERAARDLVAPMRAEDRRKNASLTSDPRHVMIAIGDNKNRPSSQALGPVGAQHRPDWRHQRMNGVRGVRWVVLPHRSSTTLITDLQGPRAGPCVDWGKPERHQIGGVNRLTSRRSGARRRTQTPVIRSTPIVAISTPLVPAIHR